MVLKREPFVSTRLEEERASDKGQVLSVRLNDDELAALDEAARLLQQEKPTTALKQLAVLGMNVLHDPLVGAAMGLSLNNVRRNRRVGIEIVEPKLLRRQRL